jgi:predicted enzyme related to lactoylglutathione lyase
MSDAHAVGSIAWTDLTVQNAPELSDFYEAVTGWKAKTVSTCGRDDFVMSDANGAGVAGVCHAVGENADLPAQWLIYIVVADLAASIAACEERGGKLINGPRNHGTCQFAVIQDPAGAVAGLYEVGPPAETSPDATPRDSDSTESTA